MGKSDKPKEILIKTLAVIDGAIATSGGLAEFVGNFVALGIQSILGKDFETRKAKLVDDNGN